jgi:hypothetical protein
MKLETDTVTWQLVTKNQSCIETFDTIYDGINLLQELAKQFEIDQGFVNMEAFQMAKLHYKLIIFTR